NTSNMDRAWLIREFLSVTVHGPRQSGKTSALMALVDSGSVVFHHDHNSRDQFNKRMETHSGRHSQVISAVKQKSYVWWGPDSLKNTTVQQDLNKARLI